MSFNIAKAKSFLPSQPAWIDSEIKLILIWHELIDFDVENELRKVVIESPFPVVELVNSFDSSQFHPKLVHFFTDFLD